MKKSLFLLVGLLVSLASAGQAPQTLPDQTIYPGNPFALNIQISRADSGEIASAALYYDVNGSRVEQPNQPSVTRYGRLLTISWSTTQTKALPVSQRLWLEIKAGALIRQGAFVTVSRAPVRVTSPGGSFTYTSPSSDVSFKSIKDLPGYLSQVTIDSKPTYVTDIASLTALTRGNTKSVQMQGGDLFVYDPSITNYDGGTTFPASNGISVSGGWRRQFSGPASADWWYQSGGNISTINSAIQTAINTFKEFSFPTPQVYSINSLIITSGAHITGCKGAVLKQMPGQSVPILSVQSDNVSIENLIIDGNRSNQTNILARGVVTMDGVSNLNVYFCTFQNIYGEALRLNGTSTTRILNNNFKNCNQPGNTAAIVARSEFANTQALRIKDNYLDQRLSLNGGIKIQSVHPAFYADIVNVDGNQIKIGEVTDEALGIEFYSGYSPNNSGRIRNYTAIGNVIQALAVTSLNGVPRSKLIYGISSGAQPVSDTTGLKNGTISGNVIQGCGKLSIELLGSNLACVGNTIENSAEISVNATSSVGGLNNVDISANTVRNSTGLFAIRIQSGANPVRNVSADFNKIFGGSKGVYFWGGGLAAGNGKFYNVSANGNKGYSLSGNGIEVDASAEVIGYSASGNQFLYDTAYVNVRAIYILPRVLQSANLSYNTLFSADNTVLMYGIQHFDANGNSQVSAVGNIINGFRNGMSFSGPTVGLTVAINQIKDASNYGLAISGSPTNVSRATNSYVNCTTKEIIASTVGEIAAEQKLFYISPGATLSITSGTITVSGSEHFITSASDVTITNINGAGSVGQRVTLYPNNNGIKYTLADNTGNLRLSSDFVMDHNSDRITLEWDGTNWAELSRSDNNAVIGSTPFYISPGITVAVTSTSVVITGSDHLLSSGTDTDVTFITGASFAGQRLTIYPASNSIKYTIKSTGNLRISGNFVMNANSDRLTLSWNGTNWIELGRSNNDGSPTLSAPYSFAGNPTTSDIASGYQAWWRNSTTGQVTNWYNNSGSMVPLTYLFGSQTFTGDGTTTVFTISHGLDHVPTDYGIRPRSVAATSCYTSAVSASTISVTCPTAPAASASVVIGWMAK